MLDANGTLKTAVVFDYETDEETHEITVQAKDELNATVEGNFTITITNVNEAPVMGGTVNLYISESENLFSIPTTWDRTFGGNGEDKLANSIKTLDGGYLLAGRSESNASSEKSQDSRGGRDYWVVKLDALGNKVWDRTFGGSAEDLCNGAVEVSSGGYLIYGVSFSPVDGDRTVQRKGISDYWIVRIDGNGNKLWDKAYGGDNHNYCNDVIVTEDGGYLLGGQSNSPMSGDVSESGRGVEDYWILKIDANGNKLWDKRFGGSAWDGLREIKQCQDGG